MSGGLARHGKMRDAGERLELLDQRVGEGDNLFRVGISRIRQIDPRREQIVGLKTESNRAGVGKTF